MEEEEEEEEARTAVDVTKAIAADEVNVEDIPTLARSVQLRKDYPTLLAPACLTTFIRRPQTKQEHHGRNSFNTSAQITAKI